MARGPWGGKDVRGGSGETGGSSGAVPGESPGAAPADPWGGAPVRRPRGFEGEAPSEEAEPVEEETPATGEGGQRHFPCASCGADLVFLPGQTMLVCAFCGHVQQIPAAPAAAVRQALSEIDYRSAIENRLPAAQIAENRVARCPNCGAEVELAANVHADRCPFCDSAVVTDTGTHRTIKPQAVLPFVLSEDEARGEMVKWLGRLWFAPSGLQEYARNARRLSGLYVPYFTFDAATRTAYEGMRGTRYTEMRNVTVMVDGRPQTRMQPVQKIRWTPVSGRVARRFDDVLVMASTGLPRQYAEELAPWNLDGLKPYSAEWLAGFRAESYTVELVEAHDQALRKMDEVIQMDIRRDIGGDAQQVRGARTEAGEETFKHILLPVWMAAYRYGGRSFAFIVNGQTGEVQGERPWSGWKIAGAVALGLLIAAIALWATTEF